MSGARSRNKGAGGERELCALLNERLGEGFASRRLGQARDGGDDITHEMEQVVSIECKRWGGRAPLLAAIEQAEASAGERLPVVVFRKDGQPWRALLVMNIDGLCNHLREMDEDNVLPAPGRTVVDVYAERRGQ